MITSNLQMKGGRGGISMDQFHEVEKTLGVKLPSLLFDLVKENDHGYPKDNVFNVKLPGISNTYETGVHAFLSFHPWSLEGILINYFERPSHFPQNELFVPFAVTGEGDYLLLFYENGKSDLKPKIYFWAHEYFDVDSGLIYVAETFESFISILAGKEIDIAKKDLTSSQVLECLKTQKSTASVIEHIEKNFGPISFVINKNGSENSALNQINICVISPSSERNYFTLVTCGMSNLPMTPPKELGGENLFFCELMLCLPPNWKLTEVDLRDIRNSWPFDQLEILAKYPYNNSTWLWSGHTVGIGREPTPFAPNTDFCAWLIDIPLNIPQDLLILNVEPNKTVVFYNAYPLYKEEVTYKMQHGVKKLEALMNQHQVCEVVDIHRKNLGKRGWLSRFFS